MKSLSISVLPLLLVLFSAFTRPAFAEDENILVRFHENLVVRFLLSPAAPGTSCDSADLFSKNVIVGTLKSDNKISIRSVDGKDISRSVNTRCTLAPQNYSGSLKFFIVPAEDVAQVTGQSDTFYFTAFREANPEGVLARYGYSYKNNAVGISFSNPLSELKENLQLPLSPAASNQSPSKMSQDSDESTLKPLSPASALAPTSALTEGDLDSLVNGYLLVKSYHLGSEKNPRAFAMFTLQLGRTITLQVRRLVLEYFYGREALGILDQFSESGSAMTQKLSGQGYIGVNKTALLYLIFLDAIKTTPGCMSYFPSDKAAF